MTTNNNWNSMFRDSNSTVEFNPATNISHIFAHWKSDTGVTLSGSNFVTAWADSIGGHVLVSSGSLTPWFSASVAATNGRPTIAFNGSNKMFSNESTSVWGFLHDTVSTGSTVAFCMKNEAGIFQNVWATAPISLGPTLPGRMFTLGYTGGVLATLIATSTGGPVFSAINPGFVTGSVMFVCEAVSGSSYVSKTSGTAFRITATGLPTPVAATTSSLPLMLGNIDGSTWPLTSQICELIIYKKTLSEVEMTQLGNYFTKKYGAKP